VEAQGSHDMDKVMSEFKWFTARLVSKGYCFNMISIVIKGLPEMFTESDYATGKELGKVPYKQVDIAVGGDTHVTITIIAPNANPKNDLPNNNIS
jgi:hypothetical protein